MKARFSAAGEVLHVQSIARHRNGVGGEPFHAVLFTANGYPRGHHFVATVFDAERHVAVLEIGKLDEGDIRFGENSWRGDHFEPALRLAIQAWEQNRNRAYAITGPFAEVSQ